MPETREAGLLRVREWFSPALAPDEPLLAAVAGSTTRLNMAASLVATAMMAVGRNPQRVILLTDRAIHVTSRRFAKRRFKKLLASYPRGAVKVTVERTSLVIGDHRFYLNWVGYQLGGLVGTEQDLALLAAAGSSA